MIRGDVIKRPKRFKSGDPIPGAKRLNELVDPLTRLGRTPAQNQLQPEGAVYLQVVQMKLNFIFGDYLAGIEYVRYSDGTEVQGTVNVQFSLPYLLRQTPFDGQTYNGVTYTYTGLHVREATDGVDTETQRITPAYVLGDIVYIARLVRGGGGVANAIRSVDLNLDGRCWAADPPAP